MPDSKNSCPAATPTPATLNHIIKVAVFPLDIAWCDTAENLRRVEAGISSLHPDTDIVVLPELFSTGFIQDPELLLSMAERHGDTTMASLKHWAAACNAAFCGSYLAKGDDGKIYNRGFFIEPDGTTTLYDKRHLFCLSPEASLFAQGRALPPVVHFRGWNISMVVCYDLRFPVWCRNKAHRYDMLIVPANWPSTRGYAWHQLLIARAIENQAVVVGADRSGTDDYGDYNNLAFVADPTGHQIAPAENAGNPGDIFYFEYPRHSVFKLRNRLPVGADADDFELTHITNPHQNMC